MSGDRPRRVHYVLTPVGRFLLAWAFFLLLLNYDPAGDSKAIDRLLVRLVNFVGITPYSNELQNQIVVVVIDPISLMELNLSWPMGYGDHAYYIDRIMAQQPAMIAMDLFFLDNNRADPIDFLWDSLHEARSRVPTFGAAPPPGSPLGSIVENEAGVPLPFLKGDITVKTDWPDMGYRLASDRRADGAYPLAYAMFKALCDPAWRKAHAYGEVPENFAPHCPREGVDDDRFHREMLITWGRKTPDYGALFQDKFEIADQLFNCVDDNAGPLEMLWRMLRYQENEPRQNCAYHPVIPLDVLHRLGDQELEAALRDKIVFYGLDHPGVPDIVNPPTMRPIAGVHLHAMALDNLLTRGARYLGTTEPETRASAGESCSLLHLDCLRRKINLDAIRTFYDSIIFAVLLVFLLRYGPADPPTGHERAIRGPGTLVLAGIHACRNVWLDCRDVWTRLQSDLHERRLGAGSHREREQQEVLWSLKLLGALLVFTLPGRLCLLAVTMLAVYYVDLHVFLIPPVNVLNILSIYLASQLLVPVAVFSRLSVVATAFSTRDEPADETEHAAASDSDEQRL
ncbi:CHASE2 domain-containing protein [Pelagibius sp. 7325]|uniref:CHASE2 domain-containing protein n=1 Tax=Pelagibius sp. 7325 TaxID=3131994 RepID=UPI0030EE6EC2